MENKEYDILKPENREATRFMKEFIRKFFDIKFWKFLGVGVINTLAGSLVMFLLYNVAHCGYWISSAANYTVGSAVSYVLNKKFTFENKQSSEKTIFRFAVSIGACYLAAYGVAKPLAMRLLSGAPVNIQENVGMLIGMGLYVILNYVAQRFFAFRED